MTRKTATQAHWNSQREAQPLSVVREATDRDLPSLLALYATFADRAAHVGCVPVAKHEHRNWLNSVLRRGFNFIAEEEGQLVAHLALIRVGDAGKMSIYVHPDFRRRGIGSSLLRIAIEQARDMGVRHAWLALTAEDLPLQTSLRQFGFTVSLRTDTTIEMVLSL